MALCYLSPVTRPAAGDGNTVPIISAHNLHHAFGDQAVLKDASLTVGSGERIGLVGNNGTGKSTLAAILVGQLEPDSGNVSRRKDAEVAYLSQETHFGDHTIARDYILSGLQAWSEARARYQKLVDDIASQDTPSSALIDAQADAVEAIERLGGWDQLHRVDEVAAQLGVHDLDCPLSNLSGGERRRIALARVLVCQPALAVLDEPTNHLDVSTIDWLEDYLQNDYTGSLLLITHDRYVLDRVATRTVELDAGALYSYAGGWEAYLTAKADRLAQAERANANRRNILRRELEWLRRSPSARTTKQQARVDRAEALRDTTPAATTTDTPQLAFSASRAGKIIAELKGMSIELGGKELVKDFDLVLQRGERIGIIGDNGAGKTTLLRLLMGELEPSAGEVVLGKNTRFSYFDQERAGLDDEASILDNIAANQEVVSIGGREINAKSYLARFQFTGSRQRQRVSTLSGGERARVAMAKFLLSPANVLLLDEPTNDLDVTTLAALEDLLIDTEATVLFVTHDRYFLDRIATAVLSFEGDGRVVRYQGSYQALRELRAAAKAPVPNKKPVALPKANKAKVPSAGLTFTEKHELERLMPLIEEAESALSVIEAKLADPDLYASRGHEVGELRQQCEAAQSLVDERIARWEDLEDKRSASET